MSMAIMGAGSTGTIMGAILSSKNMDVTLIDIHREHVKVLQQKGATVTGALELSHIPVRAITPEEMSGSFEMVFYLVKQPLNEIALPQLLPHLSPDSVVCTLQNGIPEEVVASYVGRDRTIGVTVGWGATWLKPGISMLTTGQNRMPFGIGELDGTIKERTQRVADILNLIGQAQITTNLKGIRWTKLLANASFSGMSAVLGCTFGDILDHRKALSCAAHIGNETIRVAEALGVTLEPMLGHDFRTLAFNSSAEMEETFPVYKDIWGAHRLLKASMLQDLEKGQQTEIEAINGIISSFGVKTGVQTPVNDKVVEIVKNIEAGKDRYSFDNLDKFMLPDWPPG